MVFIQDLGFVLHIQYIHIVYDNRMATFDICMNQICQQRKQYMLFHSPPIRFQPVSPYELYPNVTRRQFDMRRKAEILQYTKNGSGSSAKTTRAQKYSNMIQGKNSKLRNYPDVNLTQVHINPETGDESFSTIVVRYPDSYTTYINPMNGVTVYVIIPNGRLCDVDTSRIVYTPTSSSGVPGPVENLYLDPAVPLYNYATNNNSFSQLISENNNPWEYNTTAPIIMYNNIATNLLNLIIKDKITVYSNYFQFTTPFAIFVDGFVNPTIAENTRIDLNVTATVNSASVIVYYNNSVVNLPVTPTVTINTGTNSTLNYDISYNKLSLANNGTPPDSDNYHMLLYMGNITVSNLYLFTAPSYVYNIKLRVEVILTKPAIYSSYFTTTNYGVICNIDPTRLITQKNCIINAEPAIMIENNGFTFSG